MVRLKACLFPFWRTGMPRERYKLKKIIAKLRQIDVPVLQRAECKTEIIVSRNTKAHVRFWHKADVAATRAPGCHAISSAISHDRQILLRGLFGIRISSVRVDGEFWFACV